MTDLRSGETLDDLQNGYYILQSENGFRFGMDAVLLADYTQIRPEERVMDLGCGNGILPLLLAARNPEICMTGLELNRDSADLAKRNVAYNHLEEKVLIEQGDIREAVSRFGAASFDVLVTNPPYMIVSHGKISPNRQIAMARHEVCCTLRELAEAAAGLLRDHGRLYLVHRAFRLAEIMDILREYRLEPKRLRLVHPFADKEANLVLIEALHGGNSRVKVEPPLIIYEKPGVYTEEVKRIYRSGFGGAGQTCGKTSIPEMEGSGETACREN